MIPVGIAFSLFLLLAWVNKSRTYFILAFAYFINFIVDYFTSPNDLYLMWTYTSMDFVTAILILFFGDIHKILQAVILEMMIFCHYIMEYALLNDYDKFVESDIYVNTIMFLLLCQIAGADHGVNKFFSSLFCMDSNFWKIRCFINSNMYKSS